MARMTHQELALKVAYGLEDLHDGFMTAEEFAQWLANVFDGDVAFALGSTVPTKRIRFEPAIAVRLHRLAGAL